MLPIASSVGVLLILIRLGILPLRDLGSAAACSCEPNFEAVHRDAPLFERTLQLVYVLLKQSACRLVGSLDGSINPALRD